MSHEDLRKAAMSFLKRPGYRARGENIAGFACSIVLSELVCAGGEEIPDAIGWHYGRSVLIECKASRSDYLVDSKKEHRQRGTGLGEQRYFMVPAGLLRPEELPEGWGVA